MIMNGDLEIKSIVFLACPHPYDEEKSYDITMSICLSIPLFASVSFFNILKKVTSFQEIWHERCAYPMGNEDALPRVKLPGHEVDCLPTSSAEVRIAGAFHPFSRIFSWHST
jgi:hypothetical protein